MILKGALGFTTPSLLMACVLICTQAADTTNQPTAAKLPRLQGTWEGILVGQESAGKVTIHITSNSLRFQGRDSNDWYEAIFSLPTGTNPEELRATITDCLQTNYIGAMVAAIFKIENGTLTLAGIQDRDQEPPRSFGEAKPLSRIEDMTVNSIGRGHGLPGESKSFDDNKLFRYELRKIQPQKKNAEPSKSK